MVLSIMWIWVFWDIIIYLQRNSFIKAVFVFGEFKKEKKLVKKVEYFMASRKFFEQVKGEDFGKFVYVIWGEI